MRATEAYFGAIRTGDVGELKRLLADDPGPVGARTIDGRTALDLALARAREQQRELAADPGGHAKSFDAIAEMLRRHGRKA